MEMKSATACVCLALLVSAIPARAATVTVPTGGSLQQALNSAQPGDTIALTPGAVYTGSFTLPAKNGDSPITLRTAGDSGLPGDGARISPGDSPSLAVIRQGGSAPALQTAPGAHH